MPGLESAPQPGGHGRLRPKGFPKIIPRSEAQEPLQPDTLPGPASWEACAWVAPGQGSPGAATALPRWLHKQRFPGAHSLQLQRASLLTKVLHESFFLPPSLLKAGSPMKRKIHGERQRGDLRGEPRCLQRCEVHPHVRCGLPLFI